MFTPAEEQHLRTVARQLGLLPVEVRRVTPTHDRAKAPATASPSAPGDAAEAEGAGGLADDDSVEPLRALLGGFMVEALRSTLWDLPREDREDALQEALVVGWQRLLAGTLAEPERFGGFLRGVALRKRQHGQRRRRAHELGHVHTEPHASPGVATGALGGPGPDAAEPGSAEPGPGGLDLDGARRHLTLLIETLDERDRQVLRLSAQGWAVPRIAETLGEPSEAVRSRRRRAEAKLRVQAQERGLHLAALLALLQILGGAAALPDPDGPTPEPEAPGPPTRPARPWTPPRAAPLAALGLVVGGLVLVALRGAAPAAAPPGGPAEATQPGGRALSETPPSSPDDAVPAEAATAASWPGEVRDIGELPKAAAYGLGWYAGGTSRGSPDAEALSANWLPWPGREALLVCEERAQAPTMEGAVWCFVPTTAQRSAERVGWSTRWGRAEDLTARVEWLADATASDHLQECDPSWRREARMSIHNPSLTETAAPAHIYVELPGAGPVELRAYSSDQLGTNVNTWLLPPGTSRSTTVFAAGCGPPPSSWPTRGYVEDLTADLNRTAAVHHLVPAECRLPRRLPDDLEQCRPR